MGKTYELVKVNGKYALFSDTRIRHDMIPCQLDICDVRGTDDSGEPYSLEPQVGVNYCGTLIFRERIQYPNNEDHFIEIDKHGIEHTSIQVSIPGFMNIVETGLKDDIPSDVNTAWKVDRAITLNNCPTGLFMFVRDGRYSLGFKSEYVADNYLTEAYCFTTGEMFWGGAKSVEEQGELMVYPLEDIRAVEDAIIKQILRNFNEENLAKHVGFPFTVTSTNEAIRFIQRAQCNVVYSWIKPYAQDGLDATVSGAFIITATDQLRVYALNAGTDGGYGGAAGLCEIPLKALIDDLDGATVDYATISM